MNLENRNREPFETINYAFGYILAGMLIYEGLKWLGGLFIVFAFILVIALFFRKGHSKFTRLVNEIDDILFLGLWIASAGAIVIESVKPPELLYSTAAFFILVLLTLITYAYIFFKRAADESGKRTFVLLGLLALSLISGIFAIKIYITGHSFYGGPLVFLAAYVILLVFALYYAQRIKPQVNMESSDNSQALNSAPSRENKLAPEDRRVPDDKQVPDDKRAPEDKQAPEDQKASDNIATPQPKYLFAFFPYLKTSGNVAYRDLVIKNSDDTEGLPSEAARHIQTIRNMFFIGENSKIQRMLYTFHVSTEKLSAPDFNVQLLEFKTLVSFIYSSPHQGKGNLFLRNEHSTLFIFTPTQIPAMFLNQPNTELEQSTIPIPSSRDILVPGYEVVINDKYYSSQPEGSPIYPPVPNIWLNISQDLFIDFTLVLTESTLYGPLLKYFLSHDENDIITERILTAMTWYNRSTAIDIDESVALINLAIAFESLLDLDQSEQLTNRFKEAVTLLVGEIPRLDSWLTQFYKARSAIVHKGKSSSLMFIAADKPERLPENNSLEYRSLVSYGRQIFQVCVATIITGSQLSKRLNLASLLVTNQQRLQKICEMLSKADVTPASRILAVKRQVQDVETYRFEEEKALKIEQLIGVAKLLVQNYIESSPNESPDFIQKMKTFSQIDISNQFEALFMIKEIQSQLERGSVRDLSNEPHAIVASLIDSVWYYTFPYWSNLKGRELTVKPT